MTQRILLIVTLLAVASGLTRVSAAQEAGLEDLDKATELRLSARTPQDLLIVAQHCEDAIRKGLDDENKAFAKQIAAGAYFDLSSQIAKFVLDAATPDPRWQLFRHRALQYLDKTIEFDSELADAHMLIGQLQALPGGDEKRARSAADAAVGLYEKKTDKANLSKALTLRGGLREKPEERLADFEKALECDASNVKALEAQARAYLALGKVDEGLAAFDKLLETSDKKGRIRLAIAEALLGLERLDDALSNVTKALEDDGVNKSNAYALRARIHAMREDAKAALEDLNLAVDANPQNLAALLLRCELYLVESKFGAAREDVGTLLKARPGLAIAYQLRSRISMAEGQQAKDNDKKSLSRKKFAEAARDIRLLLRHEPGNAAWRLQLAAVYSTDDQPRRAIREIDKVLQKDEDNWMALRTRGDALLSVGDHKRAIADYEDALKLQPKNSGILNNLAWVLATSPEDKLRNGKRAIELAQMACEETEFKAAHILSTLASGYAEIGDFETAKKWAAKAVELGEESLKDQLQEELDSYEQKKPWRELQETEENPDFETPAGDAVDT